VAQAPRRLVHPARMRDVEQMREKIEVSLEGRQIVALAFGALVLLCSVFALGLALGRRLSQDPPRPTDLATLDSEAEPKAATSVPGKAATSVPGTDSSKSSIAAMNTADAASQKPAPARRPPETSKPAAISEAALAATGSTDIAVVPAPVREPLVVPPPPRPLQTAAIALTPPPRDLGAFTVQIGASPDRAEAQRLESRARAAGLKPYVVEANLGAKGTWYRVRIGSFPDKEKAGRYRTDVERELRSTAIVMASH
jgi:DedD protein